MQGSRATRARMPARVPLALALACLAVALAPAGSARATPSGLLSMSPSNTQLDVGENVSLTLDLIGAGEVHEAHIGVAYDPAVVQVVDADGSAPGVQVLPGVFPGTEAEGVVLQNDVSSGIINYQFELDGDGEATGGGTIATVQFQAIGQGDAGLEWVTRVLRDADGNSVTASGATAILLVGDVTPTATSTASPTATASATRTATATRTASTTPAPSSTAQPTRTASPAATSTARITILQNSNASATPRAVAARNGVDPSQAERAQGLPGAGNDGPGPQLWRWVFFLAALMLGGAGWFFTFALHYGDREVVIVDKQDLLRRTRRRGPPLR